MSSALKGRHERPGSLVLMWNGSDYELHRGTVILEDLFLEDNLSFLPSPHLLPFPVLRMHIGTMGPWAVLGLVGRGRVPQPAAVSSENTPSC